MTNLCIVPLFIRECKELFRSRNGPREETSYQPINTDEED